MLIPCRRISRKFYMFKKQFEVTSDFFKLDGLVEYEDRLMRVQLLFEIESKKAKVIRYQSGGFK